MRLRLIPSHRSSQATDRRDAGAIFSSIAERTQHRWKRIRGIPLVTWPKFYPADPSLGHRMLLAAIGQGNDVSAFAHAGLEAVWADELNVEDTGTLVSLANRNGLNGEALLVQAEGRSSSHAKHL